MTYARGRTAFVMDDRETPRPAAENDPLARERSDELEKCPRVLRDGRADPDLDLVEALRLGAPTAAERLVATFGDRAYRLATRITGNGSDGEEVAQDALWAVVRKIEMFRGESAFGSWLYRIVANAAYQKLRRRQSRRRDVPWDAALPRYDDRGRHALPMADWSPRVADPSAQTELRMALTAAIDELPARHRTILVMHDVEGFSNADIAMAFGLSVPLVKSRVHRARLFVRKRLGEALIPSPAAVAPQDDGSSAPSWEPT